MFPFEALGDPVRRDILYLLRDRELPAGSVVERLELPQPSISKHLKVLRDAGLVKVRIEGPRRLYSLDQHRLKELEAWLEPFRKYWSASLDDLGDHLTRSD